MKEISVSAPLDGLSMHENSVSGFYHDKNQQRLRSAHYKGISIAIKLKLFDRDRKTCVPFQVSHTAIPGVRISIKLIKLDL